MILFASFRLFPSSKDKFLFGGIWLSAIVVISSMALIYGFLIWQILPLLNLSSLAVFFGQGAWVPLDGDFHLSSALVGSLAVSMLATLFAGSFGFFTAIGLNVYCPGCLQGYLRSSLEVMAGIPSVIFGVWGLSVLVPYFAYFEPPGPSLLCGAVVLSLMILPVFTLYLDQAFQDLPGDLILGVNALNLSRWRQVFVVFWPLLKKPVAASLILSLTRALGETMVVLMVCGNAARFPESLFSSVRTMTATIALEMPYAQATHHASLFFIGFILVLVVTVLVFAVAGIQRRRVVSCGPFKT